MAENLRTSKYRNGDPIPNFIQNIDWTQSFNGAWAHYSNNSSYESTFGKLYNGYAVTDLRQLCPTGWHVPTDAEWSTLVSYLDPANGNNGEYSTTAGGKMKSTGTDFWQPSNTDATNESGFSGLPGGERIGENGNYEGALVGGKWWSASVNVPGSIWVRGLDQGGAVIYRIGGNNVRNGFCVRCVRD